MNKESQELLRNVINEFEAQCEDKAIGGTYPLKDLSESCSKLAKVGAYKYTISSFILSSIFWEIAENQKERAVPLDECNKLYSTLYQPIKKVFQNLKADVDEKILIKDIEELVINYLDCYN